MNTTSLGREAETFVCDILNTRGYRILNRNWRNRYCEIDIVARKNDVIYLVEVKYRTSLSQGSGEDYITAAKLQRMEKAGRFWVAENDWEGDWRLSAASVKYDGMKLKLEKLVEVN